MARTRIKICGITSEDDAIAAAYAGADALGFVFDRASPRYIDPERAWEIAGCMPPMVATVSVFADPTIDSFSDIEQICPTDLTQFQGSEPIDLVQQCGPRLIKSIPFDPSTLAEDLQRWDAIDEVDAILIDASHADPHTTVDWLGIAPFVESLSKLLIVSGGLDATNVAGVIEVLQPWAVDVYDAVETEPGLKDVGLLEAFCDAVQQADANRNR